MSKLHTCPELDRMLEHAPASHGLQVSGWGEFRTGRHGTAIVIKGKGSAYSRVRFCPFCGAETPVVWNDERDATEGTAP